MSVTFKKHPTPKGLASIGATDYTDIKLHRKVMGEISSLLGKNFWTVRLTVKKTENDLKDPKNNINCPWKWIQLPNKFTLEQDARQYIKDHYIEISNNYEYHLFED